MNAADRKQTVKAGIIRPGNVGSQGITDRENAFGRDAVKIRKA